MSSDDTSVDLVLFFPGGNFIEVLSEEAERLKVVLRQLMEQFLELEHSTFTVLRPISGNYILIQLCKHTTNITTAHHKVQHLPFNYFQEFIYMENLIL